MKSINRRAFLVALPVIACAIPALAKRDKNAVYFDPKTVYGDGKNGRKWGQFKETLPEKSFHKIKVQMRRVSGGDDTFVNLRFGRDGKTLENSKRVYLKSDKVVEEEWNFDRVVPKGEPLILNVYNGEVEVIWLVAWHD